MLPRALSSVFSPVATPAGGLTTGTLLIALSTSGTP
jgi:hypothetical protein